MTRLTRRTPALLGAALILSFLPIGCANKDMAAKTPGAESPQPDKILYDRALTDYEHGRYTEARLSLQTLINSYPDSEYLAKAKLAVADSYYKEGGTEGLTQAVAEYKDYETFFPFLDDAAYAQMQVGMAHYRMMEKADRDSTQAQMAEEEFQTFMLKYPKSPLVPEAEQRLREVQEILAEGDFDVARFYYMKGDFRASAARLVEVVGRYPLYSQSDRALWMLGDIYRRAARGSKNEQERARWRTQSDVEYAKLVREYPLSSFAADAKKQLTGDGFAVPPPDPQALARAQYEAKLASDHPGMAHRVMGVVKSSPDVSAAAHSGEPDLNPPGQMDTNPTEMLGGATGSNIETASAGSSGSPVAGSGQTANVETVLPTESSSNPTESSSATSADPPSATAPPNASGVPSTAPTAEEITKHSETETDLAAAEELKGSSKTNNKNAPENNKSDSSKAKSKAKPAQAEKVDKSKESTSKKKKGIHKLLPW